MGADGLWVKSELNETTEILSGLNGKPENYLHAKIAAQIWT